MLCGCIVLLCELRCSVVVVFFCCCAVCVALCCDALLCSVVRFVGVVVVVGAYPGRQFLRTRNLLRRRKVERRE